MINLYALYAFGFTISSTLFFYDKLQYSIFVLIFLSNIIIFRIFFHIKKPFYTFTLIIILSIFIFQFIKISIENDNRKYDSGFIYQDKIEIAINSRLETFPNYKYSNNQYVLHVNNSETNILLTTEIFKKLEYLTEINFFGKIEDVRNKDYIWQKYYKKLNIQYVVWNPAEIKTNISEPRTFKEFVLKYLFDFKTFIKQKSVENFSSYTSSLILGMFLGEKDELSKEEKQTFNNANLSHILVVSGYNVSLVITFIFIIFNFLNRYFRVIFATLFIILFVLLVGFDASVVRASMMGVVLIFSKIFYKSNSGINALFLVSFVMILINPFSIFDAGFHLSFLATYAILIYKKIKYIPEYIGTTIWVFIFISFYILYLAGSISLFGILSNIFVLSIIPVFMFVSFVSLLLSIFHIYIGIDILFLEVMSRYIFFIANISSSLPRIEFKISQNFTFLIYLCLLSAIIFLNNRYTTIEFIEKHYQKFVPQKSN